ncbi:MAG: hypothetical protein IKY42_04445 [Bacteroidaceae bacterium]|nr:hypothetical protein [Bacteroidaceae bacterium]
MKIFKIMALALVAMCGFGSCSEDCDHDFVEHDHSADLVGTWTFTDGDFAEALVISADGSVVSTRLFSNEYREGVKGKIVVENNNVNLTFEDGGNFKSHFDIIPGVAFSFFNEEGERLTYNYCANDLADEVIGMWVLNDGVAGMTIQTYQEGGKCIFTGFSLGANDYLTNMESTYKVVGNLMFQKTGDRYFVTRLTYVPNGTAMGDILSTTATILVNGNYVTSTYSFLRIKESLDLEGQKYDYIKTYVSNVKGEDKEINFMGYTFNFAKMDGSGLDKMLKALLFNVEFADANSIIYSYQMNGKKESFNAPIVVEGNKMTIKMSAKVPTLKDVVLYAFQDADCSQMHFYMHKTAFVNFYTNMQAMLLAGTDEQFDITNADVVNAIYDNINNAVETINVSLVMSKAAK